MSDHYSLSLFAELFCSALWVLWGTLEGRKVILEPPGMHLKCFLRGQCTTFWNRASISAWSSGHSWCPHHRSSPAAGGSIERTDVWGCTYRHMLAQCRSIGPVCWALPHTWWHWHHEECNLGYTRKAPPCPIQSHSQCASRIEARARSCTGKRWSSEQLQKHKKKLIYTTIPTFGVCNIFYTNRVIYYKQKTCCAQCTYCILQK